MTPDDAPRSALNLRLVLAAAGLTVFVVGAVVAFVVGVAVLGVVLVALALLASANVAVVELRRRQRRTAEQRAGLPTDHGLFE